MKLFFVGNTSWSMYNFRIGIMRRFKEMGYEITVLAPEDGFSLKIRNEGFRFIPLKINQKGLSIVEDFRFFLQLRRLYRSEKPDFIFHYTIKPNIYGTFAARLSRIPSVPVVTGLGYVFNSNNLLNIFVARFYRFSFRFAKKVMFLNKSDIQTFVERKIIPNSKSALLPGEGIDVVYFAPGQSKKSEVKGVSFIFSSRMLWDKGVGIYVEAARIFKSRYDDVSFNMIGLLDVNNPRAVERKTIQKWEEEGVVRYLGQLDDIRPVVNSMDCLVFPSYYNEGIPRVLLEACSMEIPVITTDNVGCRDIVINGFNGYLCKKQSVEDLVSKMELFIRLGQVDREQMGRNGREYVSEHFSEHKVFLAYKQMLSLV